MSSCVVEMSCSTKESDGDNISCNVVVLLFSGLVVLRCLVVSLRCQDIGY